MRLAPWRSVFSIPEHFCRIKRGWKSHGPNHIGGLFFEDGRGSLPVGYEWCCYRQTFSKEVRKMCSLHLFLPQFLKQQDFYRSLSGSLCPQVCGNLLAAHGWKGELLYTGVRLSQGCSSSGLPPACPWVWGSSQNWLPSEGACCSWI